MRYKSEIEYNRGIIHEAYYKNLTHPNQVVQASIKSMKRRPDRFIMYVVNETGDYWRYSIYLAKDGKYHVRKMDKLNIISNANDVDMIFAGNKYIME